MSANGYNESLKETVDRLRAEGRKRAQIGEWFVTIFPNHALFEHVSDRARRLGKEAKSS